MLKTAQPAISVVIPTYRRPQEAAGLLENLRQQTTPPAEVILVDGAPPEETATEIAVRALIPMLPFPCHYFRHAKGTAIQRNAGIQCAQSELVALIDDDIRLEPDFFAQMLAAFAQDPAQQVGGIVGYRTNQHFKAADTERWRWYRRLRLFTTYEPGRYDYQCGYPINVNLQPPFNGVREVDFMTTACAVWRRAVFAEQDFDPFFRDYGMLEDAHFALRARRRWKLWQCGNARCAHLHSPHGREDLRKLGFKRVVNYYFVFQDVARPLTWRQQWRFWRFQTFEFARTAASALRRGKPAELSELWGRLAGVCAVARGLDRLLPK